ncbi:MAG: TonB-dependent receptor [Bacteroidota bacterium]
MTLKKLILFCFVFLCQYIWAQNDSITKLKEVVVSDAYLKNFSNSQSVQKLNDSILNKNQPLLTHLLNYNTVIYFKENGNGMVSSPSFRGTTAAQTAVIWNGVNINSQLTGQTDFNTLTSNNSNSISVKAGGGSVIYGSGAIGGSVHLNNDLEFKKQFKNYFHTAYGSFNTLGTNYNLTLANAKWSSQIGISHNSSDNDYPYVGLYTFRGEQRKNLNGQYYNTSFNTSLGYKINRHNSLKFYTQITDGERHFSLISEPETKTKYVNNFNRSLLDYTIDYNKFSTSIKSAYVYEVYKYFGDINSDSYSFGKSECFISKIDVGYKPSKFLNINSVIDYNHTKGYGTSFGSNLREIGSGALLAKIQINPKWNYELGIRKELTDNYESPLLFSTGTSYTLSKYYTLKANSSRNFRIPTFNDLYWIGGSTHGNPDLKPESSYQSEIGNVISYKKITWTQTFYYSKIKDLISWKPNIDGGYSPINTNRVNTYGTETLIGWKPHYHKHLFEVNATYAYTISKNEDTGKQLFFVPFHKTTVSASYSYKKWAANYQFLYNGFVYTRSDNDPKEIIKAYKVSNLGISYDFGFFDSSVLGFQVFNLLNERYQSVENRPLPGTNFNINITLKF